MAGSSLAYIDSYSQQDSKQVKLERYWYNYEAYVCIQVQECNVFMV